MEALRKDEAPDPTLFKSPPPQVADHPLFRGGTTVGMISADAPRHHVEDATGHFGLGKKLTQMGLKHEATTGSYGGPEKSYVVYGPTREQMYRLGRQFGQEAVIYSQDGKHEMLYTHGPKAGKAHPALPLIRFSQKKPDDYFTHLPGRGYLTLHFDNDKLNDTPATQTMPAAEQAPAGDTRQTLSKAETRLALAAALRKSMGASRHPHGYEWHEGHTSYHKNSLANGVLLHSDEFAKLLPLAKDEAGVPKAPTASAPAPSPAEPAPHPTNEQAAGKGVTTYAKFAQPYGSLNPHQPSNLKFYPMAGKSEQVNKLVKDHGFQVDYAGGKHGKADLANRNYNTGHLMIWDPSAGSGGDFGEADYTDNWRKTHELAHALTYPALNEKYGEGRRMGGLGKQRTTREAKRAVEWEWMAAHKQRELAKQVGVEIPDEDFNRELNVVMHDAVHRAVTGKFTEPGDEGFVPHPHKVPLETALGMVDEAAQGMGLHDQHQVLKKFAESLRELLARANQGFVTKQHQSS